MSIWGNGFGTETRSQKMISEYMLPSNHPDRPRGSEVLPVPADMEEDGSSFLATTGAIQQDLEPSNSDQGAAQAVAAGLRDAKTANTRRAYASAWHTFCDWTILTGRQAMPADSQTVALFLGHLAAEGQSLTTINLARAAISHAHAAQGIAKANNPALHPVVAEMIKGWLNQAPAPRTGRRADHPSPGADQGDCPASRGRPQGTHGIPGDGTGPGRRRPGHRQSHGRRKTEEIRSGSFDMGRHSVLEDSSARITIQKSKNQVEPATVAGTEATARTLREIQQPDGAEHPLSEGPVFGLTGEALANQVRDDANAAGLGDAFSGHSGRIGLARRMVAAGAPNAAVQHQGRWRHGDMIARYTRGEVAGEALKWLN